MKPIRIAIAEDGRASRAVAPYLPTNYSAIGRTLDNAGTIITGRDEEGSTLAHVIEAMAKVGIVTREQHMIAPTREQELLGELERLESIACELIQDAQGEAEDTMGLEIVDFDGIVVPEDAAPELDDARGHIRDAIDILQQK